MSKDTVIIIFVHFVVALNLKCVVVSDLQIRLDRYSEVFCLHEGRNVDCIDRYSMMNYC